MIKEIIIIIIVALSCSQKKIKNMKTKNIRYEGYFFEYEDIKTEKNKIIRIILKTNYEGEVKVVISQGGIFGKQIEKKMKCENKICYAEIKSEDLKTTSYFWFVLDEKFAIPNSKIESWKEKIGKIEIEK